LRIKNHHLKNHGMGGKSAWYNRKRSRRQTSIV
jgi:hypothetical protein